MEDAAATLHEDLRSLIGTVIAGRYRVDGLIGIGGMGAVFRGHHLMLKRDVAIKVLHPDLTRDPQISTRFDREAHSSSRLDHPNCLQVTDYGSTSDGMKFMVMQLLEGFELGELLIEPLPPLRAVEMMLQILRGLEHAHDQGVIHRDLKPENVFITTDHEGDENLKLVDFGIAKIVSGDEAQENMTKLGIVFGTPQYMSPEQATGMDIDARTDLYSAGVIFYQMVAGKPPFQSEDAVALVRMQVAAEAPELPGSVPRHIREFIDNLLKKERELRFPDARAAREALEIIREELGGEDSKAAPSARSFTNSMKILTKMPERIADDPKSGRALLLSAALGVAVIAGGLWWLSNSNGDTAVGGTRLAPATRSGTAAAANDDEGPAAAQLAEIDKLLLAKKADDAEKLLHPLRDKFPEDVQLMWRQGRLLAQQRRKRPQALASYGDAIERDPRLLDDKDFYAELMDLMRDSKLREEALNLALRQMGKHGHKFLLELVNLEKRALKYPNRHRALEELGTDPENAPLVNLKLNIALDLWQSDQSLTPCQSYSRALSAVENEPDPYFLNAVEKASEPRPLEGDSADPEDAKVCEDIPARREALLATLQAMASEESGETEGDAAAQSDAVAAGAKGKKSKGKKSKGKSGKSGKSGNSGDGTAGADKSKSGKCGQFGAALLYKECR